MDFELKTLTRARICNEKCDALVVLVPQDFTSADEPLSVLAALAIKSGDFETKTGKLLSAYRTPGIAATRVLLVGGGDGSAKSIRTAVNAAVAALKATNTQRVLLCLGTLNQLLPDVVRTAVVACADAAYSYDTTKSKASHTKLHRVVVGVSDATTAKPGFDKGVALVKGLAFAKEWANRPANYATPTLLAGAAQELAKLRNIKVEILGPKEVAKLGMGSFMAVAQGSAEPLRFIVLRYDGASKAVAPVVLIGKGITFDTGGISLKPGAEMDEMKFDMCGAASVLGTFRALAELQPSLNVVGLIPASENMPDGRAVKPGDVVTSMSGQTIEILNTDAEGRLVLCDALTYAERFKPKAVIDIATLTGACVVALGGVRSALFSTNEPLALALQAAGESSLDLCWRMPLDEEYAEGLKTNFADVANIAGRAAGAVTAAKFLQRFTSSFPWAHLDIAGTAWKGGTAKGATGRPIALLLDYLLNLPVAEVSTKPIARTKSLKVKSPTKNQA
jgi:leucyl aminopeptidase